MTQEELLPLLQKKDQKAFTLLYDMYSKSLYGIILILIKDKEDSEEEAAHSIPADKLAGDYAANAQEADAKYLNKTLEIQGTVTEVRDSVMILDNAVFCGMHSAHENNNLNKTITIKGRCIGYDELFGEVKLDQCTLKTN